MGGVIDARMDSEMSGRMGSRMSGRMSGRMKSREPLDLERECECRFRMTGLEGSGVAVLVALSDGSLDLSSAESVLSSSLFLSSAIASSPGVLLRFNSSFFGSYSLLSSDCVLSLSLTPSTCIGGLLPLCMQGKDAARFNLATRTARVEAGQAESVSCSLATRRGEDEQDILEPQGIVR